MSSFPPLVVKKHYAIWEAQYLGCVILKALLLVAGGDADIIQMRSREVQEGH